MNTSLKSVIIGVIGIVLFATSLFLLLLFPDIYRDSVHKKLRIIPSNDQRYNDWKETKASYETFYFFNCTNVNEILDNGAKPKLQQLGPYVFRQHRLKEHIRWNKNNGTVTADEKITWYFLPEKSNGSLNDLVTTLNVPVISALYMIRHSPPFIHRVLGAILETFGEQIFATHTVRELLFDGYTTMFLKLMHMLKLSPFDRFGWYYPKNNSNNGLFTVYTGDTDTSLIAIINLWNSERKVDRWKDKCQDIKGTIAEFWPPLNEHQKTIEMFIPSFKRSLKFDYEKDESLSGITAYNYIDIRNAFANATENPENACYQTGEEGPSGVFNLSSIFNGCPLFASYPHFYLGEKSLINGVEGLNPNREEHETRVLMEPLTGYPLISKYRLQLNIFLPNDPLIEPFCYMKPTYFPMVWFQQGYTMNDEEMNRLRYFTDTVPAAVRYSAVTLMCISSLMLFVIATFAIQFWRKRRIYDFISTNLSSKVKDYVPLLTDENET